MKYCSAQALSEGEGKLSKILKTHEKKSVKLFHIHQVAFTHSLYSVLHFWSQM